MSSFSRWSRALEKLVATPPSFRARLISSLLIAVFAASIIHREYLTNPGAHSDFGMVWYGARALVDGQNPYELIGPGRQFDYRWELIYPGTALVAALPLAPLSEHAAAVVFVFVSTAALAFGATRNGWHLLPMFATESFVSAARLGQWSILLSAALFFPVISILALVKPQASIPILAASLRWKPFAWAAVGGMILMIGSLIFLPSWPLDWLAGVRNSTNMEPPLVRFGGVLILLVLFRWRRPESWLVLSLACLPQSWGWYGALPLLLIPNTLNESLLLAAAATFGAYVGALIIPDLATADAFFSWVGSMIVLTMYVPAVLIILRRPNAGPCPPWVRMLASQLRFDTVQRQ